MSAKQRALTQTNKSFDTYAKLVREELNRATESYGPINSPHEGYGIIKEEMDEFWDEVKRNENDSAREELIQVAAMCFRYLQDSEHWSK